MKFNKLLLLFISVVIVFSFENATLAQTEDMTADINSDVSFLKTIGVLWDTQSGTIDYNAAVTRREFATLLVKLKAAGIFPESGNLTSDVLDSDPAYHEIQTVLSCGLMTCYDNGIFSPDKNIKPDEVIYSFVRLLGYGVIAERKGGYPIGYSIVASDRGLLVDTDIPAGNTANSYQLIKMLMRALKCDILEQSSYAQEITYETKEGHTILSEYLKIYKVKGQITENEYSSLTGDSSIDGKNVKINDTVYQTGTTGADFLLGYTVTAYYIKDEGEYKLIWLSPDRTNELFIYADNLISFSNRCYTYYADKDADKIKKAKISEKSKILYNGTAIGLYTVEMMMPETGDVTLIDSTDDGIYDIIIIANYENYVVDTIDFDKRVLYDRTNLSKKLVWDGNTIVKIYSPDFTEVSEKDITYSSVLSVAKSKDNKLIYIIVNTKMISGMIENIQQSDGFKITVNCSVYEIAADYEKYTDQIELGATGEFYLDIDGKIMYFEKKNIAEQNVGYLIKTADGGSLANVTLKVFDGAIKELQCANKVIIDGRAYSNSADIIQAMSSQQLILYKLNNDGKVREVDFAYSSSPKYGERSESLYLMAEITQTSVMYKPPIQSFSGKFLIDSATKIFVLPKDKDKDEKYAFQSMSYLKNRSYSGLKAYSIGTEAEKASYLVYDTSGDMEYLAEDAPFYLVSKITDSFSEDEAVKKLYYYDQTGQETSILVDSLCDVSALDKGDLIQMITDSDNSLYSYNKAFDRGDKKILIGENVSYNAYIRSLYVNVYKKMNSSVLITSNDPSSGVNLKEMEILPLGSTILIFDESEGKIIKGTANDIIDYLHESNNYTKLFVRYTSGVPQWMIIYR